MKKPLLMLMMVVALGMTFTTTSCRNQKKDNDKMENAKDDVEDAADDVGDAVDDAADDVGDAVDDATDDN